MKSSSSSSFSNNARISKVDDEENKILLSLRNAETLSIRLLEFRSPVDFMQGVFRLELKIVAANNTTNDDESTTYVLELNGIKDPDSSWPMYSFQVPLPQKDFLLHFLLPALEDTSERQTPLQSLTIQGCGRVEGFYTSLFKCLFKNESDDNIIPPRSLSILHWADFCTNVDWELAQDVLLSGNLIELKVDYGPKMEASTLEKLCQSLSPRLQRLSLKTGAVDEGRKYWLQWRNAFQKLKNLTELTWKTHYDDLYRPVPQPPQLETHDLLIDLCRIWRSLSLRKLNLGLNYFDKPLLQMLLLPKEDGDSLSIEDFSLHVMDDSWGSVLGTFVHNNQNLCRLSLYLQQFQDREGHNENTSTGRHSLLEHLKSHLTLQSIEIKNVRQSEVGRDGISTQIESLLCAKDSVLQDFSLNLRSSSISHDDPVLQPVIDLRSTDEAITQCSLQSLYQSIFTGLKGNNNTLRTVRLFNCKVNLSESSCRMLQEALLSNSTLETLDLGTCCVSNSNKEMILAEGLGRNVALRRLDGLKFMADKNILQQKKSIHTISRIQSKKAIELYLKLNKSGRKHWIDTRFNAALMPYIIASLSSDPNLLWHILQLKTELIQ